MFSGNKNDEDSHQTKPTTSSSSSSSRHHALCSQSAATVSSILFNPLEVIKMRIMSQDGSSLRTHNNGVQYKTISHAFTEMRRNEGWRIFFRGAHVSAVAGGISHGIYMGCYRFSLEKMKERKKRNLSLTTSNSSNSDTSINYNLNFKETFACSVAANFVVAIVTNPIWFVKTRMQIHDEKSAGTASSSSFRSAFVCLKHSLYSEEKISSSSMTTNAEANSRIVVKRRVNPFVFWRGTSAQLLLSFPSSLHFPIYEYLLFMINKKNNSDEEKQIVSNNKNNKFSTTSSFFSSVILCNLVAKTIVTVLSHPLTLLRTRLQDIRAREKQFVADSHQSSSTLKSSRQNFFYYNNLRDAAVGCYKHHGVMKGFWRGLGPSLLQVVPRSLVHVMLYEMLVQRL